MTIKQKAINGLFWSFVDNFSNQGIQFIIGLVLARLLSPKEFGLVGMITVFIVISETFINGGFSSALIRKKECTNDEYNTVFYFNFITGILLYLVLFLIAEPISIFFQEPQLSLLIKITGLIIIINSFSLIQKVILTKAINFKLQTKISIISSILSGILGIGLAIYGFGVWSLVAKIISGEIITTLLLWTWNKWRIKLIFSTKAFKELFGFGSKMLVTSLIDNLYKEIYKFIIGKYYSMSDLGYFTRATLFAQLPAQSLTSILNRVMLPVLADLQDDPDMQRKAYRKMIGAIMFITFSIMLGMAASANSIVMILIGEKWQPMVKLLQIICFSSMLYPLHVINLSMLAVKGKSDIILKLEIIKKVIIVPVLFIGIFWNIEAMLFGSVITSFIAFFLNSYWSGKLINYSTKEQIIDIAPSFLISTVMAFAVFIIGKYSIFNLAVTFGIQFLTGVMTILSLSKLLKLSSYLEIKTLISNKAPLIARYL